MKVDELEDILDPPKSNDFVVGYGTGTGVRGTNNYPTYAAIFTGQNSKNLLTLSQEAIVFCFGETEMMKLSSSGEIYIRGELVENNSLAYKTFNEWFKTFGYGVR